jgi:hypothetical protein
MDQMRSVSIIQSVLLVAILVMLYLVYAQRFYPMKEYFAPVEEGTTTTLLARSLDRVQSSRESTNSHEDQFIISPDNVPTYALYQPNISGRHLNFFSHAPNTVPFYPDQLWTAQISDPYYQPAYKSYFYQEGYFYPLK